MKDTTNQTILGNIDGVSASKLIGNLRIDKVRNVLHVIRPIKRVHIYLYVLIEYVFGRDQAKITQERGLAVADSSKHRYDIWLEDGDIVYVPTTDIAKRADYIEYVWTRGIRAVGGFSSNYTVNENVDWLRPNP